MKTQKKKTEKQKDIAKDDYLRVLDRAINPPKPPDSKSRFITCRQGILAIYY